MMSPFSPLRFAVRCCPLRMAAVLIPSICSAASFDSDVCVYGGTSGGVAAAVQAARMGKTVVLAVFNSHVGGMSSGGLGVTDRGNTASISGIAAEFYRRVGTHYGNSSPVYFFEPHVAELTFTNLLAEVGVLVRFNQRLASVTKSGQRITEIAMEDGTTYRAKQFIDTTYEGDLMAMAGVGFTVGRESSATYGESLAGVRPLSSGYTYDPYVVPGDPGSGLLPYVYPGTLAAVGAGDGHVQGYNFRLCLTQNPNNRIPITAPVGYSEAQYELFARYVEARVVQDASVSLGQLIHIQQLIPNGKTDINANGELSTDWVGGSDAWATNTYAGRAAIQQAHEDYIRGLLWFYQTSSRVPANVRAEAQSWGLAADEFTDNGGWPHQLYVREARRMVSDYVMQQQNAEGLRIAPDPIALASYVIDSHGVQRLAASGRAQWEGSLGGSVPFPYGVSYQSIVPRVGECENLFSTFALSASHVAFSSVRMEPVFMMTSQAAATAAAFAIDDEVPVQAVPYAKLAAQLRADGQLIAWPTSAYTASGIVVDEEQALRSSGWSAGANAGGYQGDYYHDQSTGKGTKWVRYYPNLPEAGEYDVFLWWVESSNRPDNTPVDVVHANGVTRVTVNQKVSSGGWHRIATTNFNVGSDTSVIIRNDGTAAGTYVVADAVRFLKTGGEPPPLPPPNIDLVASDPLAGELAPEKGGRFALVRSGATNVVLTVNLAVGGSATAGEDYQALPGSVILPAGVIAASLDVTPIADRLLEGAEEVSLSIVPSTAYTATNLPSATVTILDAPIDRWRGLVFEPANLVDPLISGDLADPDGDRLTNLMEYFLGSSPLAMEPETEPRTWLEDGRLHYEFTQNPDASDVSFELQRTNDLEDWFSDGDGIEEVSLEQLEGRWRRTVRLVEPLGSEGYLRLRVRRP